jgi:hypothetical protein
MQTTKPKAIMRKVLPLFLSLALLAGLLPVSPLGTMLINDAEARAAARGPRGGAAVAGPRGAAAVGPRGNAVAATPRNYVHTGSASVTAGPRRAYAEGPRGGQAYVGPRGAAVQGPRGGTAVVRTVPVGARAVAIAGATYYVASGIYYRPVYEGSTVVYQQVENPEAQY